MSVLGNAKTKKGEESGMSKKTVLENVPVEKNKSYVMTIDDLGSEGEGIGKIEGFAVFVEGALPQEEIEVLIVKVKKRFAYGKLQKVLKASPQRVTPLCAVAAKCGGCQLQHLSYEGQLQYKTKKVKNALQKIAQIENVEVLSTLGMSDCWRYRNKVQFPVGSDNGKLKIGFYGKRSHRIVDTQQCFLQHEMSDKIIEIIRAFVEQYAISVYDEQNHRGLLRHILIKVGFSTGQVMVCFVINGEELPHCDVIVEQLQQIKGMTSVVLNVNKQKTNVILGQKNIVVWGKECIVDKIDHFEFEISPLSFFQVNPVQTKVLYQKALEFADLKGEETVLDLYCGIGTISLFFAQKAKSVVGCEIVAEAVADAQKNAKRNHVQNVEFVQGAAEDVAQMLYQKGLKADVVVIDPPRKGCDKRVLDTIVHINPQKIVYVSCDPATMARDVKILIEQNYDLKMVQPVDMFPHSKHVECVVLIQRKDT